MIDRAAPRSARADVVGPTATMITVFAGVTLVTPLLPAYRAQWQLSVATTTVLFVVYVAGVATALVAFGRLADVVGNRTVLLIAVLVGDLAAVVALVAPDEVWLIVARVLQGLAVGLTPGAVTAILTEQVAASGAARFAAFATVGGIASGLLVGAAFAGLGAAAVWSVYLVPLAVVTAWTVTAARHELRARLRGRLVLRRPVVPHDDRRAFVVALVAAALTFAAMGLFAGLGPVLLGDRSGGVVAGAAIAASAYVVSGAVQLSGGERARALPVGGAISAAGLVALAIAVPIGSLVLLLFAALLVGAGNGLLLPATLGTATRLAPEGERAGTVSTYYLALYAGIAVPLLGFGALADATSLTTAAQLFAAVVGAASIAVALRGRAPPRAVHTPS